MFKIAMITIFGILISGCATSNDDYMTVDEMSLCISHLTLPSYNIHTQARGEAIKKRGIDCSRYVEAARLRAQQQQAEQQRFDNNLNNIFNQATGQNLGSGQICLYKRQQLSGSNKICFYNCLGSEYAKTMRSVDICPPSVKN